MSTRERAAEFLTLLFPTVKQDERIAIWRLPDKQTRFFADAESAAEYIDGMGNGFDIYHGMGLVRADLESGRGKKEDVREITSVWADIDVKDNGTTPESKDAAVEFVRTLPLRPTAIVDSGHGIHAYWMLSSSVRDEMEKLTRGWHGYVCRMATDRGWVLENLGDISRVLRTPGTVNRKSEPVMPVQVIEITGELHEVERINEIATAQAALAAADGPVAVTSPTNGHGRPGVLERCCRYLDTIPPAIQGAAGGTQTLVACRSIARFGLTGADARAAFEHYNSRCVPKWEAEKEIAHKLTDGAKLAARDNEFGKWAESGEDSFEQAVELSGILAPQTPEPNMPPPPSAGDRFPAWCLRPPGLLADIIDYNLRTALFPQPELALAGALALLGTITGRKVQDSRKTRTNVYCLGLALSGSGKEHARSVNKELLIRSGGERFIGPEGLASSAGLVTFVAAKKSILFQLDEVSRLLETMRDPRRSPHLYKIGTILMQLESNSHCLWVGEAYANQKQTPQINQPHACVYGTAVPQGFWESLTDDNVSEGLLGRMFVFEASDRYVDIATPENIEPPTSLLDGIRWWVERPFGVNNLSDENPIPPIVQHSKAAAKRLDEHFAGICKTRRKEDDTRAALWSRTTGKTAKLALLLACSRCTGGEIVIDEEDVERAIAVSNWLTRRMLYQAFRHVSRNDRENASKRVQRILATKMTRTELTRKTQWLNRRQREEIVGELIESGLVKAWEEDTGGTVKTRWYQAV